MSHSFGYAFPSVDQVWLFSENFVNFSTAFHNKGRALDNCWGFIDGTARSYCRPDGHERIFCNGHKYAHGTKFLSKGCHQMFLFPLYGFSVILPDTFHLLTLKNTLKFFKTLCELFLQLPCLHWKNTLLNIKAGIKYFVSLKKGYFTTAIYKKKKLRISFTQINYQSRILKSQK